MHWFHMTLFLVLLLQQVGESVTVDKELAAVLKSSRFNKNFKLESTDEQPVTKPLQVSEQCNGFSVIFE